MMRQEWGCHALQTASHFLGVLTSLGSQESWDAGQGQEKQAVSLTVQALQHHLGIGKCKSICRAEPPGASQFETVWDADFERTPGACRLW